MQPTRRFWATGATAVFLAGLAIVFARPVPLGGAVFLGAWLLATQYRFVRTTTRAADQLDVRLSIEQSLVSTAEATVVTLAVSLPRDVRVDVDIETQLPVPATGPPRAERTVHLSPAAHQATATFTVEWPVAGTFDFDQPRVTLTDRHGYFQTRVRIGSTPTIVVEPRTPRDVHVGEGGTQIATAFGEHDAGRLGAGLDPAELREYTAGDAADRIDWKATARLDSTYVREYEAETDRVTNLVIEHGQRTALGPPGETKLAYLRYLALAFVNIAQAHGDPLGYYAVADEGVTGVFTPQSSPDHYTSVRQSVDQLEPVGGDSATRPRPLRGLSDTRRAAATLAADHSAFGTTLHPYLESMDPYLARIESRPLLQTARTYLARAHENAWTILLTDDADPVQVRETVKLLRRGGGRVSVFLAPTVLYEPGGLADLEAAYQRYVEFEEFRQGLARLARVSAFEVGPGDRVEALLAGRPGPTTSTTTR